MIAYQDNPRRFRWQRMGAMLLALLALWVAAAGTAAADPDADPAVTPSQPQKYSELTTEQKAMLDGDYTVHCSEHPTFPTCGNRPDRFYIYPADDSLFTAGTNDGDGDGESDVIEPGIDLNPIDAVTDQLEGWFASICEAVGRFAADVLVESMTWWITTDSIDLSFAATMSDKEPVQQVVLFIVVAGILTSAAIMMMSRRTEPGVEMLTGGLKYIVISSMSLVVLSGALHAGDDFAKKMLEDGADQFGNNVAAMLGVATLGNPVGVLLLGLIAMILSLIQWLMGFIRQAGIIVLYGMILFAAAGQLTPWGRQWFPRIASACIALVLYKPMAAYLYSIGFRLIGTEQSITTLIVGLMVIALCVIALPAMMKFFSFVTTQVGGGSALGAAAGGIAGGAALAGAFGGGGGGSGGGSTGTSADSHASYMQSNGPGVGTAENDPSPGNSPPALSGGSISGGGSSRFDDAPADGADPDGASGPSSPGVNPEADPMAKHFKTDAADVGGSTAASSGGTAAAAGEAGAASGGAAAGGPAGAAFMAGKAALDKAGDAVDKTANTMTGNEDTGPGMK